MGLISKHCAKSRSVIHKAISLLMIVVFVFVSGCNDNAHPTIWSTEVRSPDGQWLATARTDQYGGPGNAGIYTIVSLKRTSVSLPPYDVLSFSCNGPAPSPYHLDKANAGGTIDLIMRWENSSHLIVTYDGHATVDTQAIRFAGVDVSLQDLSRETIEPSK
jgi:hypothetical protein